jgi:hypothetical protein
MARNNEGRTAKEQQEDFEEKWKKAHPPTIQAAPPGPNGESPKEWMKKSQEEDLERAHREEDAWELVEAMQRLSVRMEKW